MAKKKREKKISPNPLLRVMNYFIILIASFFLILNILVSQAISPLFLQLLNNQYQSTVIFLKKIKNQPFFTQELKKFRSLFGKKIDYDVFEEDIKRNEEIKKLESLLKKNPQARDVLYRLYLLYQEEGNNKKANEYYRRAKEVDPFL